MVKHSGKCWVALPKTKSGTGEKTILMKGGTNSRNDGSERRTERALTHRQFFARITQ
jgi:hypothetical protein